MSIRCGLAAGVVLVMAGAAGADLLRWVNPAGGSYENAANWDLGRVPLSTDNIFFDLPGSYTVQFPNSEIATVVNGIDVLAGTVTLQGPGQFWLQEAGSSHQLRVGLGAGPATLRISNLGVQTSSAPVTVAAEGAVVTTAGGTLYTFGSTMRVLAGGLVRTESGFVSPAYLRIEGGRGESTGGGLSGASVVILPGSTVSVSGAGSRLTCNDAMTLGGNIRIENGGQLRTVAGGMATFSAQQCDLVIGAGGSVLTPRFVSDVSSAVTVGANAAWDGGANSQYRGAFTANGAGTVKVSGEYFVAPMLDQAGVNQQGSFAALNAGLGVIVDAAVESPGAVVRRVVSGFAQTYVAGDLTVSVRNPNALRIGDVIPILEHNPSGSGQFVSLISEPLGGGLALEMYQEGTPTTTFVRVVAGAPSCYTSDFNGDGDFGTDQDIEAYFACLGGVCCVTCGTADFNGDGDFGTDQDIEAFFRVLGGAAC